MSFECMEKFEEYHKCRMRVEEDFSEAFRDKSPEDRLVCEFMEQYTDCSDHINGCTRYDELAILKDDDVARFNTSKGPEAPYWPSERCRLTRDYQRRNQQGYSAYERECNEAIRELRLCRGRARERFWEQYYTTRTCNYHTSVLSSCTASVPSSCFDEESWMTLKFGVMIDEASIDPMFRYGVNECPAVKEVFEAWEDVKNSNVNDVVEVYTTTNDGFEKRDMVLTNKIKTIRKDDLENMPAILEATKDELIYDIKKKALASNSKAIADLKLEIHSLFEGIFNVVLYGTLV